jgi:hypothetical protein
LAEIPDSIDRRERTTRRLLKAGLRDDSLPSSSDNVDVFKQHGWTKKQSRNEQRLMFYRLCDEVDADCRHR